MNSKTNKTGDVVPFDMTALYDSLLEAVQIAHDPQIATQSGFFISSDESGNMPWNWRPIGAYPREFVTDKYGELVDVTVVGDYLVLSVSTGGGIAKWQREAQKGVNHTLSVILNGRFETEANFIYDGTTGWIYCEAPLPAGLNARDVVACEVEKNGSLLFSGNVSEHKAAPARTVNLNRFERPGVLIGWALADALPEFYGKYAVNESVGVFRTSGEWEPDSRMRRFQIPCEVAVGELAKVTIGTLDGKPGKRTPVHVFMTETAGFVIANPRRVGEGLAITILGAPGRTSLVSKMRSVGEGTDFPVTEADQEPFTYLNKTNTVTLPIELIARGEVFSLFNDKGSYLGETPPLVALLKEC